MTKEHIDAAIAATPQVHSPLLNFCITGEKVEKIASFYQNPRQILLVVNDDEFSILGQVSSTVVKWNRAVGAYHLSRGSGDIPSIPFFSYVGFLDPSMTLDIYEKIDQNQRRAIHGGLAKLLGDDHIKAGRIRVALPPYELDVDSHALIIHAQDLKLIGSGTTGSRLIGMIDEAKTQGKLARLHFVLAWSSLATGRVSSPNIDEFINAKGFYVMMAPKEYSGDFESIGPALIRDSFKALLGELPIVNSASYKGPLSLPTK